MNYQEACDLLGSHKNRIFKDFSLYRMSTEAIKVTVYGEKEKYEAFRINIYNSVHFILPTERVELLDKVNKLLPPPWSLEPYPTSDIIGIGLIKGKRYYPYTNYVFFKEDTILRYIDNPVDIYHSAIKLAKRATDNFLNGKYAMADVCNETVRAFIPIDVFSEHVGTNVTIMFEMLRDPAYTSTLLKILFDCWIPFYQFDSYWKENYARTSPYKSINRDILKLESEIRGEDPGIRVSKRSSEFKKMRTDLEKRLQELILQTFGFPISINCRSVSV